MNAPSSEDTRFAEYQKEEYRYIAEAHLKTIEAISAFFRYYIVLMSVPPSALALLVGLTTKNNFDTLSLALSAARPLIATFLATVALVGLLLMAYIISLRMDVILYAREVNAIRKYFYDTGAPGVAQIAPYRVLPQSSLYPAYLERGFWPLVISFLVIDSVYLLGALILYNGLSETSWPNLDDLTGWHALVVGLFGLLHSLIYIWFAEYRESTYLRSNGIGIDIDGVLNEHKVQFCKYLRILCNKTLAPASIRTIPVHQDETTGVTRDDEIRIFDSVSYWTEMPARDGIVSELRKLKNAMHLNIVIFTHRPFPESNADKDWRNAAIKNIRQALKLRSGRWRWLPIYFSELGVRLRLVRPLSAITASWLWIHEIPFDRLIIEQGTENTEHRPTLTKNRFTYAQKSKIRFFVEDDWEKASRLAHVCDFVFLIDQTYNTEIQIRDEMWRRFGHGFQMPSNVVRVKSWGDLTKCLRYLN